MDKDAILRRHRSQVLGVTASKYPPLLYVLDIRGNEGWGHEFQNVTFSVAESFSVKGHLSPLLSSVDINEDTSGWLGRNGSQQSLNWKCGGRNIRHYEKIYGR